MKPEIKAVVESLAKDHKRSRIRELAFIVEDYLRLKDCFPGTKAETRQPPKDGEVCWGCGRVAPDHQRTCQFIGPHGAEGKTA